ALTSVMYWSIRSRTSTGFIASNPPPDSTTITPLLKSGGVLGTTRRAVIFLTRAMLDLLCDRRLKMPPEGKRQMPNAKTWCPFAFSVYRFTFWMPTGGMRNNVRYGNATEREECVDSSEEKIHHDQRVDFRSDAVRASGVRNGDTRHTGARGRPGKNKEG